MSSWKFRVCLKVTFFSFSLLQTAIIPGCSSTKELNSESLSGTYIVDGRADEWNGKKMLDLEDAGLLIGIQNDASNMYVCLMSTDRATARLMTAAGMIVWIEPKNGKKFGIHYPLQIGKSSITEGAVSSGYPTEMEVLGPEKDAITQSSTLTSENDYGIAAAFRDSSGFAVLELKIPRKAKQEPYGAGIDNTLSMNIESGKIEKPSDSKHQDGSMGGGEDEGMAAVAHPMLERHQEEVVYPVMKEHKVVITPVAGEEIMGNEVAAKELRINQFLSVFVSTSRNKKLTVEHNP